MSKENDLTSLPVQRKPKPKIEDVISEYLDGDMKKVALDFVAYLRENKINPLWSGINNRWKAVYKCKVLYYINLGREEWIVVPYLLNMDKYEQSIRNEELESIILDNIAYCTSCPRYREIHSVSKPCFPGLTKTILGQEINGICFGRPLTWVYNPDEAKLNGIKKLLEFEKEARKDL